MRIADGMLVNWFHNMVGTMADCRAGRVVVPMVDMGAVYMAMLMAPGDDD